MGIVRSTFNGIISLETLETFALLVLYRYDLYLNIVCLYLWSKNKDIIHRSFLFFGSIFVTGPSEKKILSNWVCRVVETQPTTNVPRLFMRSVGGIDRTTLSRSKDTSRLINPEQERKFWFFPMVSLWSLENQFSLIVWRRARACWTIDKPTIGSIRGGRWVALVDRAALMIARRSRSFYSRCVSSARKLFIFADNTIKLQMPGVNNVE